jgi:hypothetical protein
MPRSTLPLALVAALLVSAPAWAQGADRAEPARYGYARTYADILAETARLRPAPSAPDSLGPAGPFVGISGLVVDETATPAGRLFYETFFLLWAPPRGAERTTVTLGERPLPGNGTAVVARADGEVLFQTRLPRRPDEVEDLARSAVRFVRQRLAGA